MMKTLLCLWMLAVCLIFGGTDVQAAVISDVRLAAYQPGVVRLVVELSAQTEASVFRLNGPSRLVVDFKNTSFGASAPKKIKPADFIKQVRQGKPNPKTARLVLDLPDQTLTEKHFLIPPAGGVKRWRFVMDLNKDPSKTGVKNVKSAGELKTTDRTKSNRAPVPGPKPISALEPVAQSQPGLTAIKKTKKIIVLDPGHGGADPGAISRSGKYEKNITLAMARETKKLLEDAGYKVVLTRSTDKAIALRRRYQIAHEADGDLFISIHADSAKSTSARGLSVYTISEKASDAEAAALAERENKADIILGLDMTGLNQDVSNILIDLAKIDTMNKSAQYAKLLVGEMQKETTLRPHAHKFAGFAVLKSPNIPSVLLELGYLSNRREEKLLQKSAYRKELGKALVRAVDAYFKQLGP